MPVIQNCLHCSVHCLLYGTVGAGYVLQNFRQHFLHGAYFTKVLHINYMNILCAKFSISHMHWSCSVYERHDCANVSCSSTDNERKDWADLPWLTECIFTYIRGHDSWDVLFNATDSQNHMGKICCCVVLLRYVYATLSDTNPTWSGL